MRVVTGVCILLLLLTDLPEVSPEGYNHRLKNAAEPRKKSFSLFKMASSRSDTWGQSDASNADVHKEPKDNAIDDDDDDDEAFHRQGPDMEDSITPKEALKDVPVKDRNFSENDGQVEGVQKDETNDNQPGSPYNPVRKIFREPPQGLLEKDPAKPKPTERNEQPASNRDNNDSPRRDTESNVNDRPGQKARREHQISEDEMDDEFPRRKEAAGLSWAAGRPVPGSTHRSSVMAVASTNELTARAAPNSSVAMMSDDPFSPSLPSVGNLEMRMRTCDRCLVTSDTFQCPLNAMAIELKKWITELGDLLSFGCHLEGCKNSRKCCLSRDRVFETVLTDMTDMARRVYHTFQSSCSNCPRDGGWSQWCEWGACSSSCGPGTRKRTRKCNTPTPRGRGRQCVGMATELIPCMNPDSCQPSVWSQWGPWTACSVPCGSGVQSRRRQCKGGNSGHASTCPGLAEEAKPCLGLSACDTHGGWSSWSPWSHCSVICGNGIRQRSRRCNNPSPTFGGRMCEGASTEIKDCDDGACVACTFSDWLAWEHWSSCDVTCGRGKRTRRRLCRKSTCGGQCFGPREKTVQCYGLAPCPAPWGPWSSCSATCSGVQGFRERQQIPTSNVQSLFTEKERQPCQVSTPPCPSGRQ